MRRAAQLVAVLVVAAALAAPSALARAKTKYEGAFAGGGTMSFVVTKKNKKKRVVNYRFRDFVVDCGGVPKLTSGNLTFRISISKKGKFDTVAVSGNPSNPKSKLVLAGTAKGSSANGTMKVSGSAVNVGGDPPERDDCTSAKTPWTAEKV